MEGSIYTWHSSILNYLQRVECSVQKIFIQTVTRVNRIFKNGMTALVQCSVQKMIIQTVTRENAVVASLSPIGMNK